MKGRTRLLYSALVSICFGAVAAMTSCDDISEKLRVVIIPNSEYEEAVYSRPGRARENNSSNRLLYFGIGAVTAFYFLNRQK